MIMDVSDGSSLKKTSDSKKQNEGEGLLWEHMKGPAETMSASGMLFYICSYLDIRNVVKNNIRNFVKNNIPDNNIKI